MRKLKIAAILLIAPVLAVAAVFAGLAVAQDDERSRFVRFVERQISTPDRQIRLGSIDGALSSDVRISSITIADREGVWLTIEDVHLVWSRLALIRGRLDVDLLEASSITVARPPLPPEGDAEEATDTEEGGAFNVPELPVSLILDKLSVPQVDIAEGVIGPAASLSVDGSVRLADGELDADVSIDRLDRDGELTIKASFSNESRNLAVDVTVAEPADGVIANALQIEGRPALSFTIIGEGPLSDFEAAIALTAEQETLLSGTARVNSVTEGLNFTLDVGGNLDRIVGESYDAFVDEGSRITVDVMNRPNGTLSVRRGTLTSGVASVNFSGDFSGGVPTELNFEAKLGRDTGEPVPLPFAGEGGTIRSGTITAQLGGSLGERFQARIALDDLDTPFIASRSATIDASGEAANLGDAANRRVTFTVNGQAGDIASDSGAVQDALGSALSLNVAGAWQAGAPVTIDTMELVAETIRAGFNGTIGDGLNGSYRLAADNLNAFSGLAGRDLAGGINLSADGSIGFGGLFDLMLDATANNLQVGVPAADGVLGGQTRITGGAARGEDSLTFDNFRVEADGLSLEAAGTVSPQTANLLAQGRIEDLGRLDPSVRGPVDLRFSATGNPDVPTLALRVTSPALELKGRALTDLNATFDGTLQRQSETPFDVDGRFAVDARYQGEPISLSTGIETANGNRSLQNLAARIVGAVANGSLTLRDDGLLEGNLSLNVPSLERLAPLALTEASGRFAADIGLSVDGTMQSAQINGTANQVEVAGVSLGFVDIALAIEDAFGVPALDGTVAARAVRAAGFDVRDLSLNARRDGDATDMTLRADLGSGTLDATGRLARQPAGFAATVSEFSLSRDGFSARLLAPTEVRVADAIEIDRTALQIGSGEVDVSGRIADTLDLSVVLNALPLEVANLVRADLGLAGTVSGTLDLSGTRDNPSATVEVNANGVSAAILSDRGIAPLTMVAAGNYADGTATIRRFETTVSGGSVSAFGTVGDTLDVNVSLSDLPLALANAAASGLGLSGTVSGTARLDGALSAPEAAFDIDVARASMNSTRASGVGDLNAKVSGTFKDGSATLQTVNATIGGGTLNAEGMIGDTLDVTATFERIPLAVANAFAPELDVSGTVSGRVEASGSLARPRVAFSVESASAGAAPLRSAGLGAAQISASGTFARGTVDLTEALVRLGGGEARARGRIGRRLDVTVDVTGLPLTVANGFSPGLGLAGRLDGRARASGSLANPSADFQVTVAGFSAAALDEAGIGALSIDASGTYSGNTVRLAALRASGAGLEVNASGTVPLGGGGLDLSVQARAPLSLAERFLAERGALIDGLVVADVRLTGALSNPVVTGSVQGSDISLRDPQTSLLLTEGRLDARLNGDSVTLAGFTANLGGGTVSVSGGIGLSGGFPADLTVTLRNARYADGRLFAITLGADLSIRGPLAGAPTVSGRVDVERAEITIPESLGGGATLIDVRHVHPTAAILETLRRAQVGPYADQEEGDQVSGLTLDVLVSAPARVFVRGRGIDAELGGSVRLTGPVSDIAPVGAFELVRGRLVILGQRIVFTRGNVTMLGDLNPTIDFVAETRTRDVTVRVLIAGPAEDPTITFTSEPQLPQDEVLAQLIFGRSLNDLSPFQLAQLAAAVAELAGSGGGPSFLDQVRVFSGLDNLEVVSDPERGTQARAGRYIADNIYLGVRAGDKSSGVTVNLDITRGLTVRAEALTDESALGVYYEREY
ncbi:MAG: translocation/assembly module TamB domain-containing protein [Pseudomonadota bacterium]